MLSIKIQRTPSNDYGYFSFLSFTNALEFEADFGGEDSTVVGYLVVYFLIRVCVFVWSFHECLTCFVHQNCICFGNNEENLIVTGGKYPDAGPQLHV